MGENFDEIKRAEEDGAKVFVGNLRKDVVKEDIEDEFTRIGKILRVWVARKPPGIAFVWFDSADDAKAACEDLNGKSIDFAQQGGLRVEVSHNVSSRGGNAGSRPGARRDSRRRGGGRDGGGGRDSRSRGRGGGGRGGGRDSRRRGGGGGGGGGRRDSRRR